MKKTTTGAFGFLNAGKLLVGGVRLGIVFPDLICGVNCAPYMCAVRWAWQHHKSDVCSHGGWIPFVGALLMLC
ncbi:hypothetical protein Tco_0913005 [Tanacetum coccineum]